MSRINLNWNDTSQNEDGFRVERSLSVTPRVWSWNTITAANASTFSDNTLTCNTSYVYRVWALRGADTSASPSNEISARTDPCAQPPAPTGLTAQPRTRFAVTLDWTDGDGETYYSVERWNGAAWVSVGGTLSNGTHFEDKGLLPDTQYSYRVRAYNFYAAPGSQYSLPSATVVVKTFKYALLLPLYHK